MLNAQQVEELQNSQPPTDWSQFESQGLRGSIQGGTGGLPPGMGPGFDDKLHVRFFMRPVLDIDASTAANRPIYKDVPHVTIMIPGDKNNIPTDVVNELHRRRWPRHWQQFIEGVKDQIVGTPLRMAPFISESVAEELTFFNIRTVEQLATMPDSNLTFMGSRELKNAAVEYLEKMRGTEALTTELAELREQVKMLMAAQPPAKAK